MISESAELVDADPPSDINVISHLDMAAEGSMAAHYEMRSDFAIMCDMTVSQNHVMVANLGPLPFSGCEVNRNIFTKCVIIADPQAGIAPAELQIVGLRSDAGVGIDLVGNPQFGIALDRGMVVDNGLTPEADLGANECEGTDAHRIIELGPFFDVRSWMDIGRHGVQC